MRAIIIATLATLAACGGGGDDAQTHTTVSNIDGVLYFTTTLDTQQHQSNCDGAGNCLVCDHFLSVDEYKQSDLICRYVIVNGVLVDPNKP